MKKTIQVIAIVALVSIVALACFACVPKDVDTAKEKLEKAGYSVLPLGLLIPDECDGSFYATKSAESIYALHFKTSKDAKQYYKENTDGDKNANRGVSGKWVFWGSEGAIRAFKK